MKLNVFLLTLNLTISSVCAMENKEKIEQDVNLLKMEENNEGNKGKKYRTLDLIWKLSIKEKNLSSRYDCARYFTPFAKTELLLEDMREGDEKVNELKK